MTGHQELNLADGMRQLRLSYLQLWNRYLALGGNSSLAELRRHVDSNHCPDDHDHNTIAQALNDLFVDRGHDHPVAYHHLYRREPPTQP